MSRRFAPFAADFWQYREIPGQGIAWLFSAPGECFREIGQLLQFLTTVFRGSSAVFCSAERNPAAAWGVMCLNPVLLDISLARDAALGDRPFNFLGDATFRSMQPAFADTP